MNTRYLALMLISVMPSLSGCLQDFLIRGEVEVDSKQEEAPAIKTEESVEKEDANPAKGNGIV